MNTRQSIIAGFIAVSTSFLGMAQAQGPGCDGSGPRGAMMREGGSAKFMAERAEQRLKRLRSDLKITEQQEPLWQTFAEKSRSEMGKGMQAMRDTGADAQLSAPERLERMQSVMRERLTAMEGVSESFKRLYASLTPEQKQAADQHFRQAGAGKRPERPGAAKRQE